ncbi:MAG: hypothetical protein ACR2NN_22220 [Bryobacteraceae bacterium]
MIRFISFSLSLFFGSILLGRPSDFGMSEVRRALHERGLAPIEITMAMLPGLPDAFEISGRKVTGSDERGLMYGLLEAAEQIRSQGRLHDMKTAPHTAMRGIRRFIHNAELESDWYYSRDYWDDYFSMLARERFNRFNLVFAHQTDYLAPPYPFWVDVPEFPAILARNLTPAQRDRNLETLRYISQAAVDHGIDFTLGVWEHNIQEYRKPPMQSMTEGLTPENIGPYSYAALKKVLQLCPAIGSVQMRTNNESGIPAARQVDFFRNFVFRAIHDAGRPVILDLRGWIVAGGMVKAAREVDIPVRLSTKYWAEDLGRPYQPAETYPNYSYLNFLEKPRSYGFYWELWGLGSNRLLLWGNPDYVRRAVSTFDLGGAEGFEIDPPLAQKGFGNEPGKWSVFTNSQRQRMFWKWEFERYWLFYRLWGRLSYDPTTPESAWMDEMKKRFGAAAPDVMDAYRSASQVINEIVAVHLADPNMYIWPEINPGGLVDAYAQVLPSDWRYVAAIPEAVRNRLSQNVSAKQTPSETAGWLDDIARQVDTAVERAGSKMKPVNREWLSSEPDFRVLAFMAHYHARKQRAAYALTFFDETADPAALASAERELTSGVGIWKDLVKLTDGLYPEQMAFGPDDNGHWKDKLPYVLHDLELVKQREDIFHRFGRFSAGFDFGGPVKSQPSYGAYRQDKYVLQNNVAPRFEPVAPETRYSDDKGFGWLDDGQREAVAIPLTPYLEVRAVAKNPSNLPHDVLFRDFIKGHGSQKFGVKMPDGPHEVLLLHPDRSLDNLRLIAKNGRLEIPFPDGEWSVSGIIVRRGNGSVTALWKDTASKAPRPAMRHNAAAAAEPGKPLTLRLSIPDASHVRSVRLYYRPVDQLVPFKMVEARPGAEFTIPGADISAQWDLMYYFEVINDANGGWFQPDPRVATPYYVVKTASK